MPDIFVEIDGQKTPVSKARLFEMARQGIIAPNTRLWYGRKQASCSKVNGIVFGESKTISLDDDDEDDSGQIFSLQTDALPDRPAVRVPIPQRESEEAKEAREEEEEKKQKKIILIVTVTSVFCMLVIIRGITCFMSDLSTKVKTNANIKKKGRNHGADQIPQLPPQRVETPQNIDTTVPTDPAQNTSTSQPATDMFGGQPASVLRKTAELGTQTQPGPQPDGSAPSEPTNTPAEAPKTESGDSMDSTPSEAPQTESSDSMDSTPSEAPQTESSDSMDSTPSEAPQTESSDSMDSTSAEVPKTESDDSMDSTPAEAPKTESSDSMDSTPANETKQKSDTTADSPTT